MSDVVEINRRSGGLKMLQNEEDGGFEFIVRLCRDVFLKALPFGDRRRLTKLERVDRRFHLYIENLFKEKPFLRLGLQIYPDRDGAAEIIDLACTQKLSPNELATIPPFFRFNKVNVSSWCNFADQPIEEKCKSIENQLLPLKLVLNDSNVVEFIARISGRDRRYFNNNSKLLYFIRNRFLPICNSSRRYKFKIWFHSDLNSDRNVIASILEMDEIKHCSNIEIGLFYGEQKRLPIEEISNWLERSDDGTKNNHQNQKERFLKICFYCHSIQIQNVREMLEHLAKKFVERKSPAQPFAFRFGGCDVEALRIEAQTLTNEKTNEELNILNILDDGEVEIKSLRREKKEKKKKN